MVCPDKTRLLGKNKTEDCRSVHMPLGDVYTFGSLFYFIGFGCQKVSLPKVIVDFAQIAIPFKRSKSYLVDNLLCNITTIISNRTF